MNNVNINTNYGDVVLSCRDLRKYYTQGDSSLEILCGIDFEIYPGETVSIVGSSGSGKSTFLHILAGLEKATSGDIIINSANLMQLNDNQVCQIRNQYLGFIYQFHHLLPEFSALENVLMPLAITNQISATSCEFALELLDKLGLSKRVRHYPAQLSGGERQRVAIARAVINNPQLIFADEPTGNLDCNTGQQVLDLFLKLQQELKTSLIIVTHDQNIANRAEKNYSLHEGKLVLNNL